MLPNLLKFLDDDAPLGAAAHEEEEDSAGPPHVAVFKEREASSEGSIGRLWSTIMKPQSSGQRTQKHEMQDFRRKLCFLRSDV